MSELSSYSACNVLCIDLIEKVLSAWGIPKLPFLKPTKNIYTKEFGRLFRIGRNHFTIIFQNIATFSNFCYCFF